MNNCCAGQRHFAISKHSVVLFAIEFRALSQSVLTDFTGVTQKIPCEGVGSIIEHARVQIAGRGGRERQIFRLRRDQEETPSTTKGRKHIKIFTTISGDS